MTRAANLCAIGLTTAFAVAAPSAHAAEASGLVETYAQDSTYGPFHDGYSFSGRSSSPPVISYSADSAYGSSTAHAQVSVDGYTGAMKAKLTSQVGATSSMPGRGAAASGGAFLTGSIDIVGAAPPGVATFNAVLEGTYSLNPSDFPARIGLDYSFRVGSSPEFNGHTDYGRTAGAFTFPFTWTQTVQGGDQIDFFLYLRGVATASFGLTELVALNTFKITAIDLPPGYSFTPDADGFLSQFGATTAPVPEPATAALSGIGLIALAWARRRARR